MSAKKKKSKRATTEAGAKKKKQKRAVATTSKKPPAKRSVSKKKANGAAKRKPAPLPKRATAKPAPKRAVAKKAASRKAAPPVNAAAPAPRKPAPAKKKPAPAQKRRDGAGHLDPKYAADLRARSLESASARRDDRAFLDGGARGSDSLAEEMGAEFVEAATSGEDQNQDVRGQEVTEEVGGPFVETSGATEFASGTDASNPEGTAREPFPRT